MHPSHHHPHHRPPKPPGTWRRVTRAAPCGICQRPDWCVRGERGWNCMRVESTHPCNNGGWYHPFDAANPPPPPPPALKNPMKQPAHRPDLDCGALMERWRARTSAAQLERIAQKLGVSGQALAWLGAAWAEDRNAIAFPMYDATQPREHPCGIRLRTLAGDKFAVTGSRSGIFYPYYCHRLPTDRVFVCEGPTDTAACLDLGVFALGRASCRGQEPIVLSVLRQLDVRQCVVICDNDGPGIAGAEALLARIPLPRIKFVPPSKDMRAFLQQGGTRAILEALLSGLLVKR